MTRRGESLALGALAVAAVLLWPATVGAVLERAGPGHPVGGGAAAQDDDDYERASMVERDALLAFDRQAPPGAMAVSDSHQRAWLHDGRDLTPDWEISSRLAIDGPVPVDGGEASRRVRALGVGWAITGEGRSTLSAPYAAAMLERDGAVVWADRGWTIYRLGGVRQQRVEVDACDARLSGAPDCWQGTLDDQPGYRWRARPG